MASQEHMLVAAPPSPPIRPLPPTRAGRVQDCGKSAQRGELTKQFAFSRARPTCCGEHSQKARHPCARAGRVQDGATGLRLAGLSTTALTMNCDTVLDIGIASPSAAGAGADCTESTRRRKLTKYGCLLQELLATGPLSGRAMAASMLTPRRPSRPSHGERPGARGWRTTGACWPVSEPPSEWPQARRSACMMHAYLWRPPGQGWQ